MRFQLNYKSGKPVYLQLVDQVKAAVASGALRAGSPLPGIRPLAEELRVNRNTVAKAYSELESQGVIETIAGKGCFVRGRRIRRSRRRCAGSCSPRRSTTPSFRRTTCRSSKADFLRARRGALRRVRTQARTTAHSVNAYDPPHSCHRNHRNLVRRYGRTDAVNGLQPSRAARPLLRLLRPQRRRQDDDDQVPAEPAAADERQRCSVFGLDPRARRSRRQVAASPTCPTTSRSIRG